MEIPLPEVSDVLTYAATTMTPFVPYVGLFAGISLGLAAIGYVISAFRGGH